MCSTIIVCCFHTASCSRRLHYTIKLFFNHTSRRKEHSIISAGEHYYKETQHILLVPLGVEGSRAVSALVRVGTKEIALGLGEVGWKTTTAVGVVVSKTSRESRDRQANRDGELHHVTKGRLSLVHLLGELGIQQQGRELGVAVIGSLDAVEEDGADDAATLPDASDLSKVELPVVVLASFADKVHSLGITADLGSVQSMSELLNEILLVDDWFFGGACNIV